MGPHRPEPAALGLGSWCNLVHVLGLRTDCRELGAGSSGTPFRR